MFLRQPCFRNDDKAVHKCAASAAGNSRPRIVVANDFFYPPSNSFNRPMKGAKVTRSGQLHLQRLKSFIGAAMQETFKQDLEAEILDSSTDQSKTG